MLTGWTIDGIAGPGARASRGACNGGAAGRARHAPRPARRTARCGSSFARRCTSRAAKTLLGTRYSEDGVDEAERAIRDSVRPPVHGAFVARKLVTHFVSDEPPAAAVGPRGAGVPLERRQPEGRGRRAGRPARSVARRPAQVPRAAGLAGGGAARSRREPRSATNVGRVAAATASAVLVAAGAERLRRHHAGMGRSGFTAQSRRAGTHDRTDARRCANSSPRSLLEVVDVPANAPLPTMLAESSISARRARRAGAGRPGVSMEVVASTMHRRKFVRTMCYGGLATFALPSSAFAQVGQRGPASCSSCCAAASTASRRSCRSAIQPTARCAARSAYNASDLATLDDTFGLAPGLSPLRPSGSRPTGRRRTRWRSRIAPAATSTARPCWRPGLDKPLGSSDGWLNRLLQVMSGRRAGIAIAAGMPLSLTGAVSGGEVVTDAARASSTTRSSSGWRCCIAPMRRCTTASRRRCSSRSWSARSRWRGATRAATGSRR